MRKTAYIIIVVLVFVMGSGGTYMLVSNKYEAEKREALHQQELFDAKMRASKAEDRAKKAAEEAEKAKQEALTANIDREYAEEEALAAKIEAATRSYKDERLWFVIYASLNSKSAAEQFFYEKVGPHTEDAGFYYTDQSSHYDGMKAGYWIVYAAFHDKGLAQLEIDSMKERAGLAPYMKQAIKRCDHIIVVNQ